MYNTRRCLRYEPKPKAGCPYRVAGPEGALTNFSTWCCSVRANGIAVKVNDPEIAGLVNQTIEYHKKHWDT